MLKKIYALWLTKQTDKQLSSLEIERVGWMAVGINILLVLLNAVVGFISGSTAVTAEAIHNGVDLIGSAGVVAGLRLSERKSANFPYGLYKIENIVALIIALLIFLAGYEIIRESILSSPKNIQVTLGVLVGVIFSLAIPVVFSIYQLRIGKHANSPSIIAAAKEFRSHAFSSGAVLLGLIGQSIGWDLDRWASLLVVVFIGMTGWELMKSALLALLDASLDAKTLQTVLAILELDPLTIHVKSVIGRNAGRYRFIEADLSLRTNDKNKSETACRRMEESIRREIPYVEKLIIHDTSEVQDHVVCALPVAENGIVLADCFCHAQHFLLCTISLPSGQSSLEVIHENPFLELEHGRGIQLGKWLVNQKVDIVLTQHSIEGKGMAFVLSNAGVEVYITLHEQVKSALEELVCHPPRRFLSS
ncbi:MAG: cation diffusion facilitator family transporter [Magnetococcales bacterium]|nr:cation diffusion facilitator family transporter [Magnetococcales bacterium]